MTTPSSLTVYGEQETVHEFAIRLKKSVPGGDKLTPSEAEALAQVSFATGLNPFIGEIWYIPGKGPMVGIKGARRKANEQVRMAKPSDYWSCIFEVVSPEEAGADNPASVVAAWKCILTDSVSSREHSEQFLKVMSELRNLQDPDPFGHARELVGKPPVWIGYGFTTKQELTRMNKQACAKKRAEADALKKRFDVPMVTIAPYENAEESASDKDAAVIDAEDMETLPSGVTMGVDEAFPTDRPDQTDKPDEMINPLGEWAVKYAAAEWNMPEDQTARQIATRRLGKTISKKEFIQIVTG